MMKSLLLLLIMSIATAQVVKYKTTSNYSIPDDIRDRISNTVGDFIGGPISDIISTGPLEFARGAHGAGDWLGGTLDSVDSRLSQDERENFLREYNDAVLHHYEDTTLNFSQLVIKYGYPCREYKVKTVDGYILGLFRIPYGRRGNDGGGSKTKRPVVFLMHGIIDSSDDWIIAGPEKSLGYLLADAGYDVWLGNSRGNKHSRKHINMSPVLKEFWKFSWDEIGRIDLPTMIDFALKKSKQRKLSYIGHSQGTTSFFVMCSMKPEYNRKIHKMIALAPVAWMTHIVSPIMRLLAPGTAISAWALELLGTGEFLPNTEFLAISGGILCRDKALTQDICTNVIFLICGFNLDQFNATLLPIIYGHYPAGSSVRQLAHYGQLIVNKSFRRFDYGAVENYVIYGSRVPPDYDISKVSAPVFMFYSENDWISHPKDVKTLASKLGNFRGMELVHNPRAQHMDYMWSKDLLILNKRVIDVLK